MNISPKPGEGKTMPIRAVLFDFDGTLADSFGAITASTNHVRLSYGLTALPESEVRQAVGFGLEHLIQQLVPGADPAEALARYREHHPSVMFSGTRLLPGVSDTLAELHRRGLRLGVCSNKQGHFTKQLVEALGLGEMMQAVLGPNDVQGRHKPDPAMLFEALIRLGVAKEETIYVGDMAVDVHTGQAAGIPVWLVPGGAAGLESAEAAGPDRVLSGFSELRELLPRTNLRGPGRNEPGNAGGTP
ncbi:MAG TPA: HAD-IA family hydrolase [Urbifossiella sp.]